MTMEAMDNGMRSKSDLRAEIRNSHTAPSPVVSMLIDDDDEFSRAALVHLCTLKLPDVVVHSSSSPKARSELCTNNRYDIVVVDTKKPSTNINDIINSIKAIRCETKLIVITGTSDKQLLRNICDIEDVYILQKPVDIGELFYAIENFITEIRIEGKLL